MTVTPKLALAYLALKKQSVQGTSVAPDKFMILTAQDFVPTQDINLLRTGNQRDQSMATKNKFLFVGSFQTYLFADEGAALLSWLFGSDTKTGGSDPYTHTLALSDTLEYLTAECSWYESGIVERVVDCKISKIVIDFEARKEIMLTVHLLGCSVEVQASALTPSFSNGAGEGPMRMADAVFTLSGPGDASTIAGQIQKMSITIDQGVMDQPGPGQVTPLALKEEGREISIKGTALFTSDDLHSLTFYGSSSGTSVSPVVTTGALTAKATSVAASPGPERSVLLTVAQLFWMLTKPSFDKDGKTGMIDFEAQAYRSVNTLPMTAVIKNGVSASYTA